MDVVLNLVSGHTDASPGALIAIFFQRLLETRSSVRWVHYLCYAWPPMLWQYNMDLLVS